jgi:hypothetical protein
VAIAVLIAVALVAIVEGFGWYDTYQSESFGDRRLETPRPEECGMARAVVQDFAEHHRAARLRDVGAPDRKVELRAFAWASNGPRAGRGADWRKCPGLGRFVRRHSFERMASGEMGPTLYISRARTARADATALLWVTVFPPQDRRLNSYEASAKPRTWEVKIPQGRGDARYGELDPQRSCLLGAACRETHACGQALRETPQGRAAEAALEGPLSSRPVVARVCIIETGRQVPFRLLGANYGHWIGARISPLERAPNAK